MQKIIQVPLTHFKQKSEQFKISWNAKLRLSHVIFIMVFMLYVELKIWSNNERTYFIPESEIFSWIAMSAQKWSHNITIVTSEIKLVYRKIYNLQIILFSHVLSQCRRSMLWNYGTNLGIILKIQPLTENLKKYTTFVVILFLLLLFVYTYSFIVH